MPRSHRQRSERVPAEPFMRWVRAELERYAKDWTIVASPIDALGMRLGITSRALVRYRDGRNGNDRPTETFRRRRVEDMLEMAGVAFWAVYPELAAAEDVPLEPADWCSSCAEMVSPIGGCCPWCDTRLARAA